MKGNRMHYDRKFKENAVKLSYQRDNLNDLARELGIRTELVYRWRRELKEYGTGSFSGHGVPNLTPEMKELSDLKKQIQRIETENDILKKALSIVSKSDR
ncbi:MAG: transposase [Bacteroidales bacterium]|jgi:transposase|nr:transposase [Bacteroidales bacterium]